MNNNIAYEDVIATLKDVGTDAPADVLASELLGISLDKLYEIINKDDDDLDEDYDDDNDFLQDLMDEAVTEENIEIWLDQLLESTGKSNVDELTAEEIRAEIDDIKGTIRNEEIVLGISEFAEENIKQFEVYLEVLEEMLNNKEES